MVVASACGIVFNSPTDARRRGEGRKCPVLGRFGMIARVVDVLFGCWHSHLSFPMTARRSSRRSAAASVTGTYVVCLDCGKEFAYDWQEMKIVEGDRGNAAAVSDLATKHAA
jgi:hypothetical protein